MEFTLDSGYAHIIEDENEFPHYFGREILGGMLDLSPSTWKHPKRDTFEEERYRVSSFIHKWDTYDWTKLLE